MSGLTFFDYNFQIHKKGSPAVNYQAAKWTSGATPTYNGWVASDGSWVIMETNTTNGTWKYYRGASDFAAGWAGKAGLTYVEYNELFS